MTSRKKINMKPTELLSFRTQHQMTQVEMADFLGVTYQAIKLWESGDRPINETVAKAIRFFQRHPKLMKEFSEL